MTALPADGKGGATAEGQTGWDNVTDVLGGDLGKFLRASRGRGRRPKVVQSSEGGPATRSRVKHISDLLRDTADE